MSDSNHKLLCFDDGARFFIVEQSSGKVICNGDDGDIMEDLVAAYDQAPALIGEVKELKADNEWLKKMIPRTADTCALSLNPENGKCDFSPFKLCGERICRSNNWVLKPRPAKAEGI